MLQRDLDLEEESRVPIIELEKRDEWDRLYQAALEAGLSEDDARESADDTMDYKAVGPDVYYGVSRDD